METKEEEINGIVYAVETHDDGFVSKTIKNKGAAAVRPITLDDIKAQLDRIAVTVEEIKSSVNK